MSSVNPKMGHDPQIGSYNIISEVITPDYLIKNKVLDAANKIFDKEQLNYKDLQKFDELVSNSVWKVNTPELRQELLSFLRDLVKLNSTNLRDGFEYETSRKNIDVRIQILQKIKQESVPEAPPAPAPDALRYPTKKDESKGT